jgi:hypothetical protein
MIAYIALKPYLYRTLKPICSMSNTVLDAPGRSFPVVENKVGGPFTTPAMYISPIAFLAGIILGKVLGVAGAIVFVIGVPFLFASSWIAIDPNTRRMREYWTVFGLEFGEWKAFPPLRSVSVIRVKSTRTAASRGSQTTMSDYMYKVRLVAAEGREGWDVITSPKKEEALSKASRLASLLGLDVADFTEPKASAARRR